MQSAVLLHREALNITQRNVNRTFSLLKIHWDKEFRNDS